MKIIDFARKGNVVRFYLGKRTDDWGWTNPDYKDYNDQTPSWLKPSDTYYGDDWDDSPYNYNAERVYSEFIKGYFDVKFDFDYLILEPADGNDNCPWSKDDMRERKVPCLIVVPPEIHKDTDIGYNQDFNYWIGNKNITRHYFGDDVGGDGVKEGLPPYEI